MLSLDTHVHLLISKVAEPDWGEIAFSITVAREDGIDVLCVAEHRDAVHYEALIQGIFEDKRLGGTIVSPGVLELENGLFLSSAAEVALRGGGDVGLHCAPEILLGLKKEKGAYTLAELVDHVRPFSDEAVLVAHHYYWKNKSFPELSELARAIDALELPAKHLEQRSEYEALARRLELPVIGASDAHTWVQIGSCRSEVDVPRDSSFSHAQLKGWARTGLLRSVALENASERVRISRLLRDNLEARALR